MHPVLFSSTCLRPRSRWFSLPFCFRSQTMHCFSFLHHLYLSSKLSSLFFCVFPCSSLFCALKPLRAVTNFFAIPMTPRDLRCDVVVPGANPGLHDASPAWHHDASLMSLRTSHRTPHRKPHAWQCMRWTLRQKTNDTNKSDKKRNRTRWIHFGTNPHLMAPQSTPDYFCHCHLCNISNHKNILTHLDSSSNFSRNLSLQTYHRSHRSLRWQGLWVSQLAPVRCIKYLQQYLTERCILPCSMDKLWQLSCHVLRVLHISHVLHILSYIGLTDTYITYIWTYYTRTHHSFSLSLYLYIYIASYCIYCILQNKQMPLDQFCKDAPVFAGEANCVEMTRSSRVRVPSCRSNSQILCCPLDIPRHPLTLLDPTPVLESSQCFR